MSNGYGDLISTNWRRGKGGSTHNIELMDNDALKQQSHLLMEFTVERQIGNSWREFEEVVGSKWVTTEEHDYGKTNLCKPAL